MIQYDYYLKVIENFKMKIRSNQSIHFRLCMTKEKNVKIIGSLIIVMNQNTLETIVVEDNFEPTQLTTKNNECENFPHP